MKLASGNKLSKGALPVNGWDTLTFVDGTVSGDAIFLGFPGEHGFPLMKYRPGLPATAFM